MFKKLFLLLVFFVIQLHFNPVFAHALHYQSLNKLEFDMVGSLEVKGTTVANLAGTISPNEKVNTERGSEPQVSKEKFLENFQKEAGTSRPKE